MSERISEISFLLVLAVALFLPEQGSAAPVYVGTEGCSCHKNHTLDWERSRHASAWYLLESGRRKKAKTRAGLNPYTDYTTDRKCLKCHTTGYRQPGGFADMETTPGMAGVGCEMCHGAGSEYRELHKKKTVSFTKSEAREAGQIYGSIDNFVCRQCHGHKDNPFHPGLDEKYRFDLKTALTQKRTFHDQYRLKGKHR